MKLLTLLPLTATVFGSSLEAPNLFARADAVASLVDDINTLTRAVVDLGDTVKTFEGISQAVTIAGQAQSLQDQLQKNVDNAKAAPMLDNDGVLKLAEPAQKLNASVIASLDSIIAKKDAFASASLTGVVAELLDKDNQLAKDYSAALFSKVPKELKDTAKKIVQPCLDKLQKTVDDFKSASGGSAAGGSSSSGSSSAPGDNSATSSPVSSSTATGTATTGTGGTPTTTPEASTGAARPKNVLDYGALVAAAIVAVAAL